MGFVVADSCCYLNVDLGKEKFHSRSQACNEGDLSSELLHLLDSGELVLTMEWLEELSSCCNKSWQDSHLKLSCVDNLSQCFIELKRNGILLFAQVGASKQNKMALIPVATVCSILARFVS